MRENVSTQLAHLHPLFVVPNRCRPMDWQELITTLILAAVALFVARRTWRFATGTGQSNCGTCTHCPTKNASPPAQLVTLEMDLGKDRSTGTL